MPAAALPGEAADATGGSGHGQPGGGAATPAMQPNPADQAMFASMLGLLQGWRGAMGPMAGQGGTGPAVTLGSNELVTILSLLQRDLPAQLQLAHRNQEHPLAVQIRQEVVEGARKLGVESDNLQLDGLDEDAVDLVALLFDVLLDGPQFDTDVRRKIGRMLVPYVKVAVKDRRMFMFKEHPARRLLNTVAEACEGNRGEAPQERELLGHVDSTIKRFELAEKRAAEAQRGRERLEQARSSINAELSQHRGERELPAVMDEFLARYASHHLTQVVLRDGHGSPRHEDAMRAVDDLLVAFDYAELRAPVEELPQLPREQFEAILASSGCTGDAARGAIESLREALVLLSGGERAADIAIRMPEQQVSPEPVAAPEAEAVLEIVAGTDKLDFDGSVLDRMRKLQVGSWIQLQTSPERVEPAKVSWISPISGRLLLVNRRGIRVLVASAVELAAMEKLGKVSLRDGETPFEDAMQQVASRLKSAANQA